MSSTMRARATGTGEDWNRRVTRTPMGSPKYKLPMGPPWSIPSVTLIIAKARPVMMRARAGCGSKGGGTGEVLVSGPRVLWPCTSPGSTVLL